LAVRYQYDVLSVVDATGLVHEAALNHPLYQAAAESGASVGRGCVVEFGLCGILPAGSIRVRARPGFPWMSDWILIFGSRRGRGVECQFWNPAIWWVRFKWMFDVEKWK
jgi:hypothetical protein